MAQRSRRLCAAGWIGLVLLAGLAARPALAMDYLPIEAATPGCAGACPVFIVATGEIGPNEDRAFLVALNRVRMRGKVAGVLLDSPGGFLDGGIRLGEAFRAENLTVIVGRPGGKAGGVLEPSLCASACVLALAGGAQRRVVPGSRVGVHRSPSNGPPVRDAAGGSAPINGELMHDELDEKRARHFVAMGVDPALAALAHRTPGETVRWLSPAEIARFRLASMR